MEVTTYEPKRTANDKQKAKPTVRARELFVERCNCHDPRGDGEYQRTQTRPFAFVVLRTRDLDLVELDKQLSPIVHDLRASEAAGEPDDPPASVMIRPDAPFLDSPGQSMP